MENLCIFLVTVIVYEILWYWGTKGWKKTTEMITKEFAVIALLCVPFNINGYVVTVIGNAAGEKDVYSLFSLYQRSEEGNATTFLGLCGYQKARRDAVTFIGLSGYQNVGLDALTAAGLSGYQKAGGDAAIFIGLSGYQKAGRDAVTAVGLSGYQKAGRDAVTGFGLSVYQNVGQDAVTVFGLSVYQRAENRSGSAERAFGTFEPLKAPPPR